MTEIDKIRDWLKTSPQWDEYMSQFNVDFTDAIPNNGGIFPSGLVELDRNTDIFGNTTVHNQYNFAIYCVLVKPEYDDMIALNNADWVMDFQNWVQEQSITHVAPTFGDDPRKETIKAQNGVMYSPSEDGTTAMYMIQLSVEFIKTY